MTDITTVSEGTTKDRKRKRAAVVKFGLAGAALLGIAAAATSAAWSDQAWFRADATGATIELTAVNFDGSVTDDADDSGAAIGVPAAELANLVPGANRVFDIEIANTGTAPLTITSDFAWVSGATDFDTVPTVSIAAVALPLGAGDSTTVSVTVTTLPDWAEANEGQAQSLLLEFDGTTVPES